MARVRDIASTELSPPALPRIATRDFAERVWARSAIRSRCSRMGPAALRHLMPLLIELRAAATLPKRYLELAIVAVSSRSMPATIALPTTSRFSPSKASRAAGVAPAAGLPGSSLNCLIPSIVSSSNTRSPRPNSRTRLPEAFARAAATATSRNRKSSSSRCGSRCAEFFNKFNRCAADRRGTRGGGAGRGADRIAAANNGERYAWRQRRRGAAAMAGRALNG